MKKYLIVLALFLLATNVSANTYGDGYYESAAENAKAKADASLSEDIQKSNAEATARKIEAINNPVQVEKPIQVPVQKNSSNKYLIILAVILGLGVIGFLIKKNRNKIT